jgi:creatinine amidohydrolase
MMHLEPDLVLPLETAGNGKAKNFKIIGLKEGWVTAQRQWTRVTKDTGVGNPALATAEKGKLYLKDVTEKISEFFIELERIELGDLYE